MSRPSPFRLERDAIVAFPAPSGERGEARFRLYESSDGVGVAVISEVAGNRGPTASSAFASVAEAACARFGLVPQNFTWIAHDAGNEFGNERFDFVVLAWRGGRARIIYWTVSSAAAVRELFGPGLVIAGTSLGNSRHLRLLA